MEKLLQLEIPEQAQWMRVMLTELTRLNSHLVWLGTHALDIGAMSMFFYCFREREEILRIFEMFSGQRMMTSYIRIGGLALGAAARLAQAVGKFIDGFPSKVDEYEDLLNNNPIWMRPHQGRRLHFARDMLDLGVTGPMLRAAGLQLDVRKDEPYSSYEKFDFKVPTRTENDVYARYRVRMEEMRQSAQHREAGAGRDAGRALGMADAPQRGAARPRKDEDADGGAHLSFQDRDRRLPRSGGRGVSGVESPRGEIGYYVVSDGTSQAVPRAHAHAELRQPAGAACACWKAR